MKFLAIVLVVVLVSAGGMYGYLTWQAGSSQDVAAPTDPLQPAIDLAGSRGCLACHSVDGSAGIGPSWVGGFGKVREFADGTFAEVNAEYLRESMLQPAARVVKGYENVMVPVALSEEDIQTLISLIEALAAREVM